MKYSKIILLLTSIFFFASCELSIEKEMLDTEDKFVAPELLAQSSIIVNANNIKKESVTFNWNDASFGSDVQIEYVLWGKYGENEARIGSSFSNSLTITKQDLNGILTTQMGVAKNATAQISSYIVATILGTSVKEVVSNEITYNVSTFESPRRWLYMPGEYQGWDIGNAPMFWETEGGTNVYETLVKMEDLDPVNGAAGFKVTDAQNWSSGNFGTGTFTPDWTLPLEDGDNFMVDISSVNIFTFSVNTAKNTISKTDVKSVTIIGSFGGWEAGELDMEYDPKTNIWSSPAVTFSGDLNFLVRLDKSWDKKIGTNNKASEFVEGGIELEKGAGDILVPEAGTYVMRLHANRTPYVLVMEKQ